MFPSPALFRATSRSALNPKRFQTGLYDGRSLQSGNAIGETYNSKTRRTWLPNRQSKVLYSEALGRKLKLTVTVGAMRTIDKVGGLDAYLFRMKPDRLGEKGMQLRDQVHFLTSNTTSGPDGAGYGCTCAVQGRATGAGRHAAVELAEEKSSIASVSSTLDASLGDRTAYRELRRGSCTSAARDDAPSQLDQSTVRDFHW